MEARRLWEDVSNVVTEKNNNQPGTDTQLNPFKNESKIKNFKQIRTENNTKGKF